MGVQGWEPQDPNRGNEGESIKNWRNWMSQALALVSEGMSNQVWLEESCVKWFWEVAGNCVHQGKKPYLLCLSGEPLVVSDWNSNWGTLPWSSDFDDWDETGDHIGTCSTKVQVREVMRTSSGRVLGMETLERLCRECRDTIDINGLYILMWLLNKPTIKRYHRR